MSSNRKSTTNLITEIQTLAIAISQAGVKQVMVDYAGHCDLFSVSVYPGDTKWGQGVAGVKPKEWGFRVFLGEPKEEVITSLLIIRDRMDELMLQMPEGRECAA